MSYPGEDLCPNQELSDFSKNNATWKIKYPDILLITQEMEARLSGSEQELSDFDGTSTVIYRILDIKADHLKLEFNGIECFGPDGEAIEVAEMENFDTWVRSYKLLEEHE